MGKRKKNGFNLWMDGYMDAWMDYMFCGHHALRKKCTERKNGTQDAQTISKMIFFELYI